MRRALVCLVLVVTVLFAAPAVASAQSSPDDGTGQTTEIDDRATSIIGSPKATGPNNFGGLIVGAVLLGGWTAGGALLLRNGRRRRDAAAAAAAASSGGPVAA